MRLVLTKVRLIFEKQGRARFISHLDLLRCMQRAFKRAQIPIWYSQGYNPRAYIMFPLALSLGICSRCEVMDIDLTEELAPEEIIVRMNWVLPEGIRILRAAEPVMKHTEIAFAQYSVQMSGTLPSQMLQSKFMDFMNLEKIEIEKLSKKKVLNRIDIKPGITVLNMNSGENILSLDFRLPAGTQENLNINVVIEAFEREMQIELENICIERTKILSAECKDFF